MKNLSIEIPVTNEVQKEYYKTTDYRVTLPPRSKEIANERIIEDIVPRLPLNDHEHQSRGSFHSVKNASSFHNSRFSSHIDYNHKRNTTEGFQLGKSNVVVNMPTSPSSKLVGNRRNTFKINSKSRNHYGRGSNAYRDTSNSPPRSFKSSHMNNLTRSNVNYGGTYTAAENKLEKLRD